ncbi:MAG TPA: DUF4430 domain-containing protein [Candidatus Thermoplasmatota archaeon]|nr:DUF4430 domain-containing protein [Candidatus Thermoplasmatota archaeon]
MNRPTAIARLLPSLLLLAALGMAGCAETGSDAQTSLQVRFGGHSADLDSMVDADLGSRPTASRYESDGVPHPDGFTAHDQLEAWAQTGHTYNATAYQDTGFGAGYFLTDIDGVAADGATAFWALSVNGQESSVGMSEAVLHDGDTVTWTYTPVGDSAANDPNPIGVTVDPPPPTQAETTKVTGSVNRPARVSIDGGPGIDVEAGRWELVSQPLAFGQTPGKVRVEDGVHSVVVNVTFVRLASATFEALYTAYPVHDDTSDLIWYDPGTLASLPLYDGKGAARAATYSVHDFMVAWSTATGREVEYSYSESFGFGVSKIDGVGQPLDSSAPPYWCYKVNGESADLGISLQPMAPGDVVTWEYAGCM